MLEKLATLPELPKLPEWQNSVEALLPVLPPLWEETVQ